MRLNRDTIIAIVLLVFSGVMLAASFEIREPDYGQLSPAAWPRTIIGVLAVLSLIYLIQSIRKGMPEVQPESPSPSFGIWLGGMRNVFWCFALFLAYLLALPWVGMLIGGMLFVFSLLSVLGGWSLKNTALHLAIAAATVGGMWALFTYGLGVLLPRGELFGSF